METKHFFILGSMKCGTTSLYTALDQHPDICMSQGKEPVFFELDREYHKGKDYYLEKYFSHREDESFLGEARPRNLFLPWVPDRILNYFPDAKFLVILRNPVDRAYSFYWAARRSGISGTEDRSFNRAIYENYLRLKRGETFDTGEMKERYQEEYEPRGDGKFTAYLEEGYYHKLIQRYVRRTSGSRIKVLLFKDFIEDQLGVCNDVFSFLGLPEITSVEQKHQMESYQPRSYWLQKAFVSVRNLTQMFNVYDVIPDAVRRGLQRLNVGSRSFPDMDPLTELWLYQHFEEPNRKLEEFLGRSLDDWHLSFQR